MYSAADFQACSATKLRWNDSCIPNEKDHPEIPDACECSDINMVCDVDQKICLCKKQEIFHHTMHRSRRNATNFCKVAHQGFCEQDEECENRHFICERPHKYYLKPPKNLRYAKFCLRKREAQRHNHLHLTRRNAHAAAKKPLSSVGRTLLISITLAVMFSKPMDYNLNALSC